MHDYIDGWAKVYELSKVSICDNHVRSKHLTSCVYGHATHIAWPEQQLSIKVHLRHQKFIQLRIASYLILGQVDRPMLWP